MFSLKINKNQHIYKKLEKKTLFNIDSSFVIKRKINSIDFMEKKFSKKVYFFIFILKKQLMITAKKYNIFFFIQKIKTKTNKQKNYF